MWWNFSSSSFCFLPLFSFIFSVTPIICDVILTRKPFNEKMKWMFFCRKVISPTQWKEKRSNTAKKLFKIEPALSGWGWRGGLGGENWEKRRENGLVREVCVSPYRFHCKREFWIGKSRDWERKEKKFKIRELKAFWIVNFCNYGGVEVALQFRKRENSKLRESCVFSLACLN